VEKFDNEFEKSVNKRMGIGGVILLIAVAVAFVAWIIITSLNIFKP
jgi:hypothetical protein